jgi:hypothetical protein
MQNCHPNTEDPKIALLDQLYEEDGRGDKSHPMHGLYTGLYQQHINGKTVDVSS